MIFESNANTQHLNNDFDPWVWELNIGHVEASWDRSSRLLLARLAPLACGPSGPSTHSRGPKGDPGGPQDPPRAAQDLLRFDRAAPKTAQEAPRATQTKSDPE